METVALIMISALGATLLFFYQALVRCGIFQFSWMRAIRVCISAVSKSDPIVKREKIQSELPLSPVQ